MDRLNDYADVKVAVAATAGSIATLVATKIDATGFGRARFVFNVGNGAATTAAISAGIGVWQASTSGATYAEISASSLAAVTSGTLSSTSVTMVIDVPTSAGTPWLQISGGSMLSTGVPYSCVCTLYNGINHPPSSPSHQQLVTV